jgi:hypothetical protein
MMIIINSNHPPTYFPFLLLKESYDKMKVIGFCRVRTNKSMDDIQQFCDDQESINTKAKSYVMRRNVGQCLFR